LKTRLWKKILSAVRKIFEQMQFSLVAPEGAINFAAKKEGRVIVHAPKPL